MGVVRLIDTLAREVAPEYCAMDAAGTMVFEPAQLRAFLQTVGSECARVAGGAAAKRLLEAFRIKRTKRVVKAAEPKPIRMFERPGGTTTGRHKT